MKDDKRNNKNSKRTHNNQIYGNIGINVYQKRISCHEIHFHIWLIITLTEVLIKTKTRIHCMRHRMPNE